MRSFAAHQLAFNEQQPNQERVRGRIGPAVVSFCRRHEGDVFHMDDLRHAVAIQTGVAPDSPGRILRDLKQNGLINYEVVNRGQSLYRVLPLTSVPPAAPQGTVNPLREETRGVASGPSYLVSAEDAGKA